MSRDKSGKSCSLADVFDQICERDQVKKRTFLYQQRWFAKLGKAAAAIVDAHPMLIMLLDEASNTNQLTQSCNLYLSSEFFLTELETLAWFNYRVTFPYLYYIEKSSQEDLLIILPQLYHDLLQNKTDTLKDFVLIFQVSQSRSQRVN